MKAKLKTLLRHIEQSYDYAHVYRTTDFTGNNTESQVTGLTIRTGTGAYFDAGTDQITIRKTGRYLVFMKFRLSAMTTAANVKRITLKANGSEKMQAMSRAQAWEDVMSFDTFIFEEGDVLTITKRAEDGNSTYRQVLMEILPLL